MPSEPYVLLIATGQSPQVLTETVWSLARQHQPSLFPSSVEVVTTATGKAHLRARLLGDQQFDPVTGNPVPEPENRWEPFCRDVLGLSEPVPIHIHVPALQGMPLDDVQTLTDDAAFADLCYALVGRLTREHAVPIIGSIAGGRKTMSAHLMTAFSVFARPQDRLTHVLVSPDPLPGALRNGFFYPTEETAGLVRIRRVDIEFPRLHGVLKQMNLDLPEGPADLRALLAALEPHTVRERVPSSFRVRLGDRKATLMACDEGGVCLDTCELTASEAAIFLVTANAIELNGGAVEASALFYCVESIKAAMEHPVHLQRMLIEGYCHLSAMYSVVWMQNSDVSKAISRVNKKLSRVPVLERFLAVESEGKELSLRYRWPEPLPGRIEVEGDGIDRNSWTLDGVVLLRK